MTREEHDTIWRDVAATANSLAVLASTSIPDWDDKPDTSGLRMERNTQRLIELQTLAAELDLHCEHLSARVREDNAASTCRDGQLALPIDEEATLWSPT